MFFIMHGRTLRECLGESVDVDSLLNQGAAIFYLHRTRLGAAHFELRVHRHVHRHVRLYPRMSASMSACLIGSVAGVRAVAKAKTASTKTASTSSARIDD